MTSTLPAAAAAVAGRSQGRNAHLTGWPQPRPHLYPAPALDLAHPIRVAHLAARIGRTGLAPFLANPGAELVDLVGGLGAAAYVRRRNWAITPGDVVAPEPLAGPALSEYLQLLARRHLRPVFMAVSDRNPYLERGLALSKVADEALVELAGFDLRGPARAGIRHAVSSARRASLVVVSYSNGAGLDGQLAAVSREWLGTKRGGELGFTLSRHDQVSGQLAEGETDLWAVLDATGAVQAWCTWRHYLGGQGRVLDIMRRRPSAPNPAMDFLIAEALGNYRDSGVAVASLACVPIEHGSLAERIYPARSLRAYKQKFDPRWESRWLAVPRAWQRPAALAAICGAYCPGGLRRALARNS